MIRIRNSRLAVCTFLCPIVTLLLCALPARGAAAIKPVERWGIFELTLKGPNGGNPFVDVQISAEFTCNDKVYRPHGFYDGNGIYKIRFMPGTTGKWRCVTRSNIKKLNGTSGQFVCMKPSRGNHGPVRVADKFHFAYADGTPYFLIGTTAYCWHLEKTYGQTLKTLKTTSFNKVRFMPFPHRGNPLPVKPFAGENHKWDFSRPNPKFWQFFENSVKSLLDLGIEADVILFHPYDRKSFGLDKMNHQQAIAYVRYVVARLAAYRNVWWSMANEYDLIKTRTVDQWEALAKTIAAADPYEHMHSIHCLPNKRYPKWDSPWVTHISYQGYDPRNIDKMRQTYKKPIVLDEHGYEGNIRAHWGKLSPEKATSVFWQAVINGGYATHGDCYKPGMFFWKGGVLAGRSHKRLSFFAQKVLDIRSPARFTPVSDVCARCGDGLYLYYFGDKSPDRHTLKELPAATRYRVDLIDTWNMTIKPLSGTFAGNAIVKLPGKKWTALRLRKVK